MNMWVKMGNAQNGISIFFLPHQGFHIFSCIMKYEFLLRGTCWTLWIVLVSEAKKEECDALWGKWKCLWGRWMCLYGKLEAYRQLLKSESLSLSSVLVRHTQVQCSYRSSLLDRSSLPPRSCELSITVCQRKPHPSNPCWRTVKKFKALM